MRFRAHTTNQPQPKKNGKTLKSQQFCSYQF